MPSSSSSSSSSASPSFAEIASGVADLGDRSKVTPQQAIDKFWKQFTTKNPGKATTVIPSNTYTDLAAKRGNQVTTSTTQASYEDAAATCRAKVEKIVKECRRINKKYRDPHFDIEVDLKLYRNDCLHSLSNVENYQPGEDLRPQSVKRVGDIFEKPCFYIDGPTANDVRQGRDGDCWLMAALCTLSEKPGLIERLCVAHDQDVGVYGFVFYRDGAWISEIVDDFLYLIKPDYDEGYFDRILFDDIERVDPDEAYRRIFQSNSSALYFAQCQHPQETWLPLLEKCYAKAHGDYGAIEGGFGGEGIEDLTGGVTSELLTTDILDKEYFWKEELLKVNQEFLFGCNTGIWGRGWGERKGIVELHAYSIQKAVEIDGKRLLKLKNPWGRTGDGSKEWTAEWLQKLDHRFGDDGDFWISYEDLLRKYQAFERTRLFTDDWRVSQLWTTLSVPWALDYHDTHFSFTLSKSGPVVLVLAQLDDRYFRGLEGQYMFELGFRLHKAGHSDYVVRSQTPYRMTRSVNVELELEAGDYEVRVKINATRNQDILPIEKVIKDNAKSRREKLLRIGLAYDLGHCKGRFVETPEEKAARKEQEAKIKQKKRDKIKAKLLKERQEAHYLATRQFERDQHKRLKRKEKLALKKAAKKARQEARKAERAAIKAEKAAKKAAEAEAKAKLEAEEAAKKEKEEKEEKEAEAEAAKDEKVEAGEEKAESKPEEPMTPESTADDDSNEKEEAKEAEAAEPKVDEKGAEADAEEEEEEPDIESEPETDVESVGTLATLADRELWIHVDNYTGTISSDSDSDNESTTSSSSSSSEAEKDPWNAVVVAGIRIFHTGLGEGEDDGDINLKVIRPIPFGKDDEEVDVGGKCSTKVLDVDDSAKDATLVGDASEKIRFIKGDGAKRRTATTFF
ncbi:micromolar calcium activated neutral protease 1 (capn1) [Fusarium subglutinans]|uniref:Micromolar calcium activated neutral protease 1 (Capn1) n=1 Tax=Gibberella subglutinans TaxID=42677 RepID=A0A8H5V9J6_GIBSU|nr:micromolar calcium activated neutral protease 1 (capn1) [Fusarium subglutinans]KAF5614223.1 micromolar calcium activated neutral protease 1 (capn1) [Fusarium subglutinans]